jgi:hypothetical protein
MRSTKNFWINSFHICLALLAVILLPACHSDREIEALEQRFQQYQTRFSSQELLALADLSDRLDSLQLLRQLLMEVDTHTITPAGKEQREILIRQLESEWTAWEPYRRDPSLYNLGGLLKQKLVQPESSRLADLRMLLDGAENYYRNAQQNLAVSDMSLYRLAAQKQYLGLEFLRAELPDSLQQLVMTADEKEELREKIDLARRCMKDYLAFCESNFLNHRDSIYQAEHPRR